MKETHKILKGIKRVINIFAEEEDIMNNYA